MKIRCQETRKGVSIKVHKKVYKLEFPEEVWKDYPENLKVVFVENYAYLKSLHLPKMLNNGDKIDLNTSSPLFKNLIYNAVLRHIPFCSDVDGVSTAKNIKDFMSLSFEFGNQKPTYPFYNKQLDEKAVVPFSFGKDSLLTFGIADELGLEPTAVMSLDNDCPLENKYKKPVSRRFEKDLKTKVWKIKNNTGKMHLYKYWNVPKTEWGYGHLITEFCFNMLPFVHYLDARHIIFGNENSCNNHYINSEGFKSYPVYDQSSEWMLEMSKMTKAITNNQVGVFSFIEPLNELAIIKVLHERYPQLGKYQMSCFPDDSDHGKEHYWCGHCSKCARMFIFLKAHNIDPEKVGFNVNMLNEEYIHKYSLFGIGKNNSSLGWDVSGLGRDEQLYAFYLAYKNGAKGEVITRFKECFLKEAVAREDELNKRYLGINEFRTIPRKFQKSVLSIYKEALVD
ncbi:hypothetical protein A3K72_03685 [Candidatus Woesearchaeota archaeon RBG_13_36_6]|nr:MAG: hypothetical protein A3K72_03685 [Candidatus Woesearchaeota archaeon RBG_13_36_6]